MRAALLLGLLPIALSSAHAETQPLAISVPYAKLTYSCYSDTGYYKNIPCRPTEFTALSSSDGERVYVLFVLTDDVCTINLYRGKKNRGNEDRYENPSLFYQTGPEKRACEGYRFGNIIKFPEGEQTYIRIPIGLEHLELSLYFQEQSDKWVYIEDSNPAVRKYIDKNEAAKTLWEPYHYHPDHARD